MTIKAISMPSDRFERCSLSSGNLYLNLSSHATPKELEKCLSLYSSIKLKSELENGETMLNELLRCALSKAASLGNTRLIEYIVKKWGPHPLNMGDKNGEPILGAALSSPYKAAGPTAALLIQLGAKVNILIEKLPFPAPRGTLLELVVCIVPNSDRAHSYIQLLLRNGARIQDPTNLTQRQLHCLILAQTKLAQKVETAKKRADEVRGTLTMLPTDVINIINEMEEEPLVTEPVELPPAPSQPTGTASRNCIVM